MDRDGWARPRPVDESSDEERTSFRTHVYTSNGCVPVQGGESGGTTLETGATTRPGWIFRVLDPKYPHRARRRFGKLYWKGWQRLVMSLLLTLFGITFTTIGGLCTKVCTDVDRGIAFLVIGLILLMPGLYGFCMLLWYVRGHRGYNYKDLPGME